MGTPHLGIWYPKSNTYSLLGYSDIDFASSRIDRKNTTRGCQFIKHSLVSWQGKKQNNVPLSTAEAKYIEAGSCCVQLLWMKQQLSYYGLNYHKIPILCYNISTINLTKNPKTKHIQIRHYFIKDHIQRDDISLRFNN